MKNRTMTLEQAYRYVFRRVDFETRKRAIISIERAKKNEMFQFVAWTRYDAMEYFLEKHGAAFVELADDDGLFYRKVQPNGTINRQAAL